MIALSLEVVAEIVGGRVEGDGEGVVVSGPVVIDGREAGPGSLFVAFVGEHTDGHEHVPQAADHGAVAVLGTRATGLPTVVVDDPQTRARPTRGVRRRAGARRPAGSRSSP